jgi:hypothetical protein
MQRPNAQRHHVLAGGQRAQFHRLAQRLAVE